MGHGVFKVARLLGWVKRVLVEVAATHQAALCSLGLRTCKECRALRRSQQGSSSRKSS
jgi:hypothetical protein